MAEASELRAGSFASMAIASPLHPTPFSGLTHGRPSMVSGDMCCWVYVCVMMGGGIEGQCRAPSSGMRVPGAIYFVATSCLPPLCHVGDDNESHVNVPSSHCVGCRMPYVWHVVGAGCRSVGGILWCGGRLSVFLLVWGRVCSGQCVGVVCLRGSSVGLGGVVVRGLLVVFV